MRVAVTGTPGTGKTTAVEAADTGLDVVHLNDLVREADLATGEDPDRGSLVADLDAIADRLAGREDVIIETHLAHHLDADRVVVLRCHPESLRDRLLDRGEARAMCEENAKAEALDVVLSEAVAEHGREAVYEIDTTNRPPAAVAADVEAVVAGDREPTAGTVDFTDYL
ncbi:adenylate kinase [Halobacteriales archaeon QS_1_69_70]|nr:MAG: adenylate kinase [Halobacteriales archaeon QS_1_69_70]